MLELTVLWLYSMHLRRTQLRLFDWITPAMPSQQTHLQLPHTSDCLVCGRLNPHGLKLDCFVDPGKGVVRAMFTPQRYHCGFAGIVHGGLLATVLDEIMTWTATWHLKRFCFAGEMTIRFCGNAKAGEPLQAESKVQSARSRLIIVSSKLTDSRGALVTIASGKYVPLSAEQHCRFVETLLESPGTRQTLQALRNSQTQG